MIWGAGPKDLGGTPSPGAVGAPGDGLHTWYMAQPGRCRTCHWHIKTQGHGPACSPVAPTAARDAVLDAVSDAAHPHLKAALEQAIRRHAARRVVFSMNDLRDEVNVTGPVVGAVFGQLSKAGVIEHVGYEHSTKANTKAHDIKTWIGAAA